MLVLPANLFVVWRLSMASEFDRRVEALAKQGFPVSLDDLDKAYVLPEGVENAADIYIEAFSYYQQATAEENDYLPISGNYIGPDDVPPFPDEVIEAMETHLKTNEEKDRLIRTMRLAIHRTT